MMVQLFKKTLLASTISVIIVAQTYAATVRSDVPYEDFRNFAENKGRFFVGANNIEIKNQDGQVVGTVLQNAPMPDFSATHRLKGTSTLIDPQYVASVAHNNHDDPNNTQHWHYHIQFGGQSFNPEAHHYNYAFVATNDNPLYHPKSQDRKTRYEDYQVPRLHKMVTEVVPVPVSAPSSIEDLTLKQVYSEVVRMGSGTQAVLSAAGTTQKGQPCADDVHCTQKSDAYHFLTGGEALKYHTFLFNGLALEGAGAETKDAQGNTITHVHATPMANFGTSGDSGSPVYAYNKLKQRWELIALHRGRTTFSNRITQEVTGVTSQAIIVRPEFNQNIIDNNKITIDNQQAAKVYQWASATVGNSVLAGESVPLSTVSYDESISSTGFTERKAALNAGKTLHFTGQSGTLQLQNSINQGAGALHFDNDFSVKTANLNDTWLGAGVMVAKDKTVTWQVKNPKDDRLSKLGEGTLLVNGTGDNQGDISVGDGTVILNQQQGKAFEQVGIVSGRPTVKLMNDKQFDPNKLYFGYRGGRLDIYGNDLTFNHIQNLDEGAQIVNHHPTDAATVTVVGQEKLNDRLGFRHYLTGDGHAYILRGNIQSGYPKTHGTTLDWVYLGNRNSDGSNNIAKAYYAHKNAQQLTTAFNGVLGETNTQKHNGILNVSYDPSNKPNAQDYTWLLSGGSRLNGDLTVKAGTVLLSGRPTPYAIDVEMEADSSGEYSVVKNKKEVIKDHDWINRSFSANNFNVMGESKLYITRNVAALDGNIYAKDNAFVQLGFDNGTSPVCIRSDYHGETTCHSAQSYADDKTLSSIPVVNAKGNLTLLDNSQFQLGKARWLGSADAKPTTKISLLKDAHWVMTDDSTVGNLALTKGSQITLNAAKDAQNVNQYNTLNIVGDLSGEGQFNYLTNLFALMGDKVNVRGTATGHYVFDVKNTGTEPKGSLVLLSANNNQATAKLLNLSGVDLGAYRYQLIKDGNQYRLHNLVVTPPPLVTTKGTSVKAEPLQPYTGEITTKGTSVKAEPLQPYDINLIASSQKPTTTPKQAEVISRYTNTALSELSSGVVGLNHIGHGLNRYLMSNTYTPSSSSLVHYFVPINQRASKLWFSADYYKDTAHQSNNYRQYKKTETLTQVGADTVTGNENGHWLFGGAWSNSAIDNKFADNISGKTTINMLSLYGKLDTVRYGFVSMDVGYGQSTNTLYAQGESPKFNRNLFTTGINVGKTFQVAKLEIQPSLGLRYHHLSDVSYQLDGALVNVDDANVLSYRAGVAVSKPFVLTNGLTVTPMLASHYLDANKKSSDVFINDVHSFKQEFGRYIYHEFGLSLGKKLWEASLTFSHATGNEIDEQQSAGLKLNYRW